MSKDRCRSMFGLRSNRRDAPPKRGGTKEVGPAGKESEDAREVRHQESAARPPRRTRVASGETHEGTSSMKAIVAGTPRARLTHSRRLSALAVVAMATLLV